MNLFWIIPGIIIVVGIITIILVNVSRSRSATKTEKNTSTLTADTTDTTKSQNTQIVQKTKVSSWDKFSKIANLVLIAAGIVFAFIIICSIVNSCDRLINGQSKVVVYGFSGTKYDAYLDGKPITYIESGTIGPGKVWETSRVHYRFAFRTQNYVSYQVEFTSKNCGWTRSVLYKKGEINRDPLPDDATQGPVRVSTLPGETSTFEVILYKTD
ncbi:MAG TPA: hypothetical protein PKZ36_02155 [Candidatus Paceibacterota bacterium]|nr:hypothetical protein [Candidatus Paceibacterota bacterium]HPT18186.1 hypothetical protein [Candidatus Paceibacterota bacterium]